jgi:hypothetical protein
MFEKNVQHLDMWDLGLTKLAVASGVLAVLAASPKVRSKVESQDPRLFFLAAGVLASRPLYRFFFR